MQETIVGLVAVIIKVTSIDPAEKHLEKTLTEMQPLVQYRWSTARLTRDRFHCIDRVFATKGNTEP